MAERDNQRQKVFVVYDIERSTKMKHYFMRSQDDKRTENTEDISCTTKQRNHLAGDGNMDRRG